MPNNSIQRIDALFWRYAYLLKRNLVRLFDIFFWPVMELLLWGFMTLYIQQAATGALAQSIVFLIGALISWDIHYRSQLAISVAVMEEIWTRNFINMLIAPMRWWEYLTASILHASIKVGIVVVTLTVLAKWLYAFTLIRIGWAFIPLAASLLIFGWALGLFTVGLLLRYGYAAEALIWGIPFLIQPFSCVFYPLNHLPSWAQPIARCLPSTYAFEGLRAVLQTGSVAQTMWFNLIGLTGIYFLLGLGFAGWMLNRARTIGCLGRIGQD